VNLIREITKTTLEALRGGSVTEFEVEERFSCVNQRTESENGTNQYLDQERRQNKKAMLSHPQIEAGWILAWSIERFTKNPRN